MDICPSDKYVFCVKPNVKRKLLSRYFINRKKLHYQNLHRFGLNIVILLSAVVGLVINLNV